MKKILFLLLFFVTLPILAQRPLVEGYCLNQKKNPIPGVKVVYASNPEQFTMTNSRGMYQILAHFNDTLHLVFSIDSIKITRKFYINNRLFQDKLPDVVFNVKEYSTVLVHRIKEDPFELMELPKINLQRMISVEKYLTLTKAATSNNELTSNYNVRGGNYDENLVYVNGYLVYRPFLTRSGQQEGMSFIHSAMVESVKFSAGGFDSQYGDRLSSVLDITYKTPDTLKGSLVLSGLSEEAHIEGMLGKKFTYLAGMRYRSNGYFLNSLPTKGAYNPVFADGQFLGEYPIGKKLRWSLLAHFSSNNYRFAPQTSNTDFGTANEAYSFRIYFDGKESTRFQTAMVGTSLTYNPSEQTQLALYLTRFQSDEREYFDIQGQYYINELETDPSKDEYGDSIAVLGIGTFLNHARNKLNAQLYNVYHEGSHELKRDYIDYYRTRFVNSQLKWGLGYELDLFNDVLSEWKMVDSAGYSLPQGSTNEVELFETIKGDLSLINHKTTGYFQWNYSKSHIRFQQKVTLSQKVKINGKRELKTISETLGQSATKFAVSIGTRAGYTSINEEYYVTPRVAITYFPRSFMVRNHRIAKRNLSYRFAVGTYYQPPFYREFRTFNGVLNPNVKSQKSVHAVLGADVYFNMWQREKPFKFTGEIFYKYLWDVNPYEIENVRTRYYANNDAVAYATGIDFNVHGEFVPGIESFFKMGILQTRENLKNDTYKEYYNAAGEKIIFGYSEDQTVVDSAVFYPGFIPRPTDQLFTFGALVQDKMPGLEDFTVQMGLQYGAPLPYGPPGLDRYKDTLRMRAYFRVDLGLSYNLNFKKNKWWKEHVPSSMVSLEIFNLLGINNVLSKQWVQDVQGKYYSIPNYLTQRMINVKFICQFN